MILMFIQLYQGRLMEKIYPETHFDNQTNVPFDDINVNIKDGGQNKRQLRINLVFIHLQDLGENVDINIVPEGPYANMLGFALLLQPSQK